MQTILKTTIAAIALTAIMAVPASAITQAECQQIQQTAHQMAECARQLGYPEDVVRTMRNMGFYESEFPYWVREDGCKMLGDKIMVAANLNVHPRGSVVETSRGFGIVCDTGGFARSNPYQLDLATNWQ